VNATRVLLCSNAPLFLFTKRTLRLLADLRQDKLKFENSKNILDKLQQNFIFGNFISVASTYHRETSGKLTVS